MQLSATDAGAIYEFDEAGQEFTLRSTYGMDEGLIAAIKERHVHIGESGIGQAAAQRAPLQMADAEKEAHSEALDIVVRAGYRALLFIPLLGAEDRISAVR